MGNNMNKIVGGSIVLLVLLVAVFIGGSFGLFEQSATGESGDSITTPSAEEGLSAVYYFKAMDKIADPITQVASNLYVSKTNGQGQLIFVDSANAEAMSSSTATDVSGFVTGETLNVISFKEDYYYGSPMTVKANAKTDTIALDVNTIASVNSVYEYFEDSGDSVTNLEDDTTGNLTIGATETKSITDIVIKNGDDESIYKIKGIGFNLGEASNITITMGDSKWKSASTPDRLKNYEYYFELDSAVDIVGFKEMFHVGAVNVKAGADDPSETITMVIVDEGEYVGQGSDRCALNKVCLGTEDDATTPTDVGGDDDTATISIA